MHTTDVENFRSWLAYREEAKRPADALSAWLQATTLERERSKSEIDSLRAGVTELEMAEAAAMALVLSHEAKIDALRAELAAAKGNPD